MSEICYCLMFLVNRRDAACPAYVNIHSIIVFGIIVYRCSERCKLELYSRSSEEDLEQFRVGDRVTPINEPHLGRYDTVESVGSYWIVVKINWATIVNRKRQIRYSEVKHNLRVYIPTKDEQG